MQLESQIYQITEYLNLEKTYKDWIQLLAPQSLTTKKYDSFPSACTDIKLTK